MFHLTKRQLPGFFNTGKTLTVQEALVPEPSFAKAVIVAVPLETAVIFPAVVTVTTFVLELLQATALFVAVSGA